LGIKSVELAGGGEPALYPRINDLTDFISDNLNLDIGINTNGLNLHKIHLYRFKWIRLSLNFIDNVLFLESPDFSKRIEILRPQINNLTACYIVPKKIGTINLQKVVDFAEKNRIFTRIAPDCIQTKDEIKVMIDKINKELPKSEYCFCSDFNVFLQERPENFCAMQYIKPLLFTDGWVYPCPSFELAIENGTNVRKDFRLCYGTGVYEYYKHKFEILKHTCSYCKYAKQNEILCNLLKETEFNNFV
jgi:MoaA/NifB/PqqE/SkfB family radical SAM enzyme